MVGRTKPILKADRERFRLMQEIGCLPCRKEGHALVPAQTNHLLKGYRIGHQATVGECPWHHMGEPPAGLTRAEAKDIAGPSRALHKREFRDSYGTDTELLAEQDRLIEIERGRKV